MSLVYDDPPPSYEWVQSETQEGPSTPKQEDKPKESPLRKIKNNISRAFRSASNANSSRK